MVLPAWSTRFANPRGPSTLSRVDSSRWPFQHPSEAHGWSRRRCLINPTLREVILISGVNLDPAGAFHVPRVGHVATVGHKYRMVRANFPVAVDLYILRILEFYGHAFNTFGFRKLLFSFPTKCPEFRNNWWDSRANCQWSADVHNAEVGEKCS